MKLEIKHLAPYLPYAVNGYHLEYKKYWAELHPTDAVWFTESIHFMKIVLHPLSDLTKEIEVNGEKFVPLGVFYEMYGGGASSKNQFEADYYDNIMYTPYKSLSYETVQKLFEWHFDVFGLIENGLAIDINTLNK